MTDQQLDIEALTSLICEELGDCDVEVCGNSRRDSCAYGVTAARIASRIWPRLKASEEEGERLRGALDEIAGFDADEFGAALYAAFWQRNEVECPPWKEQAAAIRQMWRSIAVDAVRFIFSRPAARLALTGRGEG